MELQKREFSEMNYIPIVAFDLGDRPGMQLLPPPPSILITLTLGYHLGFRGVKADLPSPANQDLSSMVILSFIYWPLRTRNPNCSDSTHDL